MANTPVTTLDARYSVPGALPTRWEVTNRALESDQVFWISTVRSDGRPHVTPCTALWLDGTLYFQAGPTHQKFRNLKANPHVILTTGCNQWEPGLDVMVEGDAVPVSDNHLLERLANEWEAKTDGRFSFVVHNGVFYLDRDEALDTPILVFSVAPTQILAFARDGVWSHTVHRF
jgi:general stress protein 26